MDTQRRSETTPGKLGSGVSLLSLCSPNSSTAMAVGVVVCQWQVAEQEGVAVRLYSPHPQYNNSTCLCRSPVQAVPGESRAQHGGAARSLCLQQLSRKRLRPWGVGEHRELPPSLLCVSVGVRSRCVPGCVCDGAVTRRHRASSGVQRYVLPRSPCTLSSLPSAEDQPDAEGFAWVSLSRGQRGKACGMPCLWE